MDRQKIEKAVDQMTLMDDDFMCQVFDENYEGVELVLGIILKQPDIKVTKYAGRDITAVCLIPVCSIKGSPSLSLRIHTLYSSPSMMY